MTATVQPGTNFRQILLDNSAQFASDNVNDIRDAVSKKHNLQELFHTLVRNTASKCARLASEHDQSGVGSYGVRRDDDTRSNFVNFSPLSSGMNNSVLIILASIMRKLSHTNNNFHEKQIEISSPCLNKGSVFEFELLTETDVHQRKWHEAPSIAAENAAAVLAGAVVLERGDKFDHKTLDREIKKMHPDFYKRKKMACYFDLINQPKFRPIGKKGANEEYIGNFSEEQALYVLGTARLQVNGKRYAIAHYLTKMYQQQSEDPIERLKKYSTVCILHQDIFLIDDMMTDIAKIFKKAIEWKGNIQELKNYVALICYELSFAFPYKFENEVIVESLQASIYRYHGFQFEKKGLVQVTAHAIPMLALFMERYNKIIDLKPINH